MMFLADTTALSTTAITVLLAALGLSSTAGLRAYLPLLAIGIAGAVPGPFDGKLLPLQSNFTALSNPLVLVILGALALGEFTIDKIPVVDHISDAVHTIIRPLSGAIIMAGTTNTLSIASPWAAAALGGVLAFAFHGAKATTRPAVTATTAGIGNLFVSLIEDAIVVVAVLVLVLSPIIGIILMALLVIAFWRVLRRVWRLFRGRKAGRQAQGRGQPGVIVNAAQPTKRGRGGRGRRGQQVPQIAGPVVTGAVVPAAPPVAAAAPPVAPAATPAPTGPASPTATTLAGTQQATPYAPPAPAYAPYAPAQAPGMPPQPTQTIPGQTPGQGLYPGDATTLPGSYQGPKP